MSATRVVAVFTVVVGLVHVAAGLPAGCSRQYNSSHPSNYFFLDQTYFAPPLSSPSTLKGSPMSAYPSLSTVTSTCGKLCARSPFGFFLRSVTPFRDQLLCYCYTAKPDFSRPEYSYGLVYVKGCPVVKKAPPPKKTHPPPPPFRPTGCKYGANSTDPYGFYQIYLSAYDFTGYVYRTRTSRKTDVWPEQNAAIRCSTICKGYKDGFYVAMDKFLFTVDCYCLKKPINFKSRTEALYLSYTYYTKTCK